MRNIWYNLLGNGFPCLFWRTLELKDKQYNNETEQINNTTLELKDKHTTIKQRDKQNNIGTEG